MDIDGYSGLISLTDAVYDVSLNLELIGSCTLQRWAVYVFNAVFTIG